MVAMAPAKLRMAVLGRDLHWLMQMLQIAKSAFAVTVVHTPDPFAWLTVEDTQHVAVIELSDAQSAIHLRVLLEAMRGMKVVFVADSLPLRHAVARVVRAGGHAVIGHDAAPLVIVATAVALLAGEGVAP